MSFGISVTGHKDHKDDAAALRAQRKIEREARTFVKALAAEGVSAATLSDARGSTDLLAKRAKGA